MVGEQHSLHSDATMEDEAMQRELEVSLIPCYQRHGVGGKE